MGGRSVQRQELAKRCEEQGGWQIEVVERDKSYAMQAEKTHPTKTLRQSQMEERWDKRMPVAVGSPLWVAKKIRNAVAKRLARRAS